MEAADVDVKQQLRLPYWLKKRSAREEKTAALKAAKANTNITDETRSQGSGVQINF